MRIAYYRKLSRSDRAVYRRSDEYGSIEVPDAALLRPIVARIAQSLERDDRAATARFANATSRRLCEQLGVTAPAIRVLARRPSDAHSELHGLYERHDDGRSVIRVWMRTAVGVRPVAFRTFVRTLLHELCHHFDFELLELPESFHTHGFFERESSLARQLLPAKSARSRSPLAADDDARGQTESTPDRQPSPQLRLPGL